MQQIQLFLLPTRILLFLHLFFWNILYAMLSSSSCAVFNWDSKHYGFYDGKQCIFYLCIYVCLLKSAVSLIAGEKDTNTSNPCLLSFRLNCLGGFGLFCRLANQTEVLFFHHRCQVCCLLCLWHCVPTVVCQMHWPSATLSPSMLQALQILRDKKRTVKKWPVILFASTSRCSLISQEIFV